MFPRLTSITIRGYRPFRELVAPLGPLEVLVGANGTGKSSLFEFLRFLRDSVEREIPPEIVEGNVGRQLFHFPGPQRLSWALALDLTEGESIEYEAELMGPVGSPKVTSERVLSPLANSTKRKVLMNRAGGKARGVAPPPNELVLGFANNPREQPFYRLREYIRSWRFYGAFGLAKEKIRQPVFVEQEPTLREDASNLSAILHFLYTEHPQVFAELQQHLRSTIPGFRRLSVKARGAPGQVIALWEEQGLDSELSLADLSDGTLHLLSWIALCLHPNPPALVCVDEPDQGVHPRTLPLLGALFQTLAERSQVLLATHSSYLLLQFDLEQIAVLRREEGEARFYKPRDSAALKEILADFGPEEIEVMHRSDELEQLA